MPKETRLTPGDDVLARLMHAALLHALRNAEEADNALSRSRWPLAFTLAEQAFEEVGKASLCLAALVTPDAERATMSFSQLVNNHRFKIFIASFMSAVFGDNLPALPLERLTQDLQADAKRIHQARMRGMYVDYTEDGTIIRPDEVTEEQARTMTANLHAALRTLPPVLQQPEFDYAEFVAYISTARSMILGASETASPLIPAQVRAEMESWIARELTGPFGGVGLPEFEGDPDQVIPLLRTAVANMKQESGSEHVPDQIKG